MSWSSIDVSIIFLGYWFNILVSSVQLFWFNKSQRIIENESIAFSKSSALI